ncbi:hypothetical protein Ac2012v2_002425 [Leucoagaricus gongylophorus]
MLGFEPIKPVRLTPVWFPGWVIDAEVQGDVNIQGAEHRASAQIFNAYVVLDSTRPRYSPNMELNAAVTSQESSDYQVLSSAPLLPPDAHARESVPFTQDLLRQFDLEVVCIPYNISPFSILNIAHHLSHREAIITQDFRFNPSSLKPTLFAAYPVLIPVYLLQYEIHDNSKKYYHTLIVEAYGSDGNAWSEPLRLKKEIKILQHIRPWLGTRDPFRDSVMNVGYSKQFVEHIGFSHRPHQKLGNAIGDYIEKALDDTRTPTMLSAASVNNMAKLVEDQRVREFTSEDRKPIIEWLQLGLEQMKIQQIMSHARSSKKIRVRDFAKVDRKPVVDQTIQLLSETSQILEAQRLQVKPIWAKTEEDLKKELQAKPRNKEGSDS